jgi:hypothetical protein
MTTGVGKIRESGKYKIEILEGNCGFYSLTRPCEYLWRVIEFIWAEIKEFSMKNFIVKILKFTKKYLTSKIFFS